MPILTRAPLRTAFLVVGVASVALMPSCRLLQAFKRSSSSSSSSSSDGGTASVEVSTTDEAGVVSAELSADSALPQVIRPTGTLSGSAVVFPPGALQFNTTISLEEADPLATSAIEQELGIASASEIRPASTAVVISTSVEQDPAKPFTLALPLIGASLRLVDGQAPVVIFRVRRFSEGGKLYVGVIPAKSVRVTATAIEIDASYFGSYQAAYVDATIEEPVETTTIAPIRSKVAAVIAKAEEARIPGEFAITVPGAAVRTATPTITWGAADGAALYRARIARDAACNDVVQRFLDVRTTSVTLTSLIDGTYYICAQAHVSALSPPRVASNSSLPLVIDTTAPGAFAIIGPAGFVSTLGAPDVTFSASAGASRYVVKIAATESCAVPVQTHTQTGASAVTLAALGDAAYYICASAFDVAGNETRATNSGVVLTIDSEAPGTFAITAPLTASTTATPTVTWTQATGATSYRLSVATASGCAVPIESLEPTEGSVTLSSLADGTYYLCLTAGDTAGNSRSASNTNLTFVVDTSAPGAFSITAPARMIDDTTFTAQWGAASGAASYSVRVTTNSDCSGGDLTTGVTTTSHEYTGALDNIYYLCVTAVDAAGNSIIATNTAYRVHVTNGLVLGQADATTVTGVRRGLKLIATSGNPQNSALGGATITGTKLILPDPNNHRILIWNTLPTTSYAAPDVVVGQPDFYTLASNQGGNCTANTLYVPVAVAVAGGKMYVADLGNHRVLVYNSVPTSNDAAADAVLGQSNLTSCAGANRGASAAQDSLSMPVDVFHDGSYLYVVDKSNNRLMIWSDGSIANSANATRVLGQANFTTSNTGCNSSSLNSPAGVTVSGTHLYVVDTGNHRLLRWDITSFPPTNGYSHSSVITQSDSSTCTSGATADRITSAFRVIATSSKLLLADYANHRILIWNSLPTGVDTDADVVIGQPDLTSATENNTPSGAGTLSAKSLRNPTGLASDGTKLFVVDSGNNRVLGFGSIPTSSQAAADIVLGQPEFTTKLERAQSVTSTTFGNPVHAFTVGEKLVVVDSFFHRILIWNTFPTSASNVPSLVLGQSDFTSGFANRGGSASAETLHTPGFASSDGTKLVVADQGNHRVLIWNTFPTASGQAADTVVGQAAMSATSANQGGSASATSLSGPSAALLVANANTLIVTDNSNHRVLVYSPVPTAAGASASRVIGQPSFTASSANQGASVGQSTLRRPTAAAYDGTSLYIVDLENNRILGFSGIPAADGANASFVLGQSSFTAASANAGGSVSASGFKIPIFVGVKSSGGLFVSENYNHRVLRWTTTPITQTAADIVYGQSALTTGAWNSGGLSLATLAEPNGVHIDATYRIIADTSNRRVVIRPE